MPGAPVIVAGTSPVNHPIELGCALSAIAMLPVLVSVIMRGLVVENAAVMGGDVAERRGELDLADFRAGSGQA